MSDIVVKRNEAGNILEVTVSPALDQLAALRAVSDIAWKAGIHAGIRIGIEDVLDRVLEAADLLVEKRMKEDPPAMLAVALAEITAAVKAPKVREIEREHGQITAIIEGAITSAVDGVAAAVRAPRVRKVIQRDDKGRIVAVTEGTA